MGSEPNEPRRHSKFLAYVLRHAPETIGLPLERGGWVDVEALLDGCASAGHPFERGTLERVVAENDKQRFAFSADGLRIRANQGHSVDVELELPAREPPELLYHGTARRFLERIRAEGLTRQSRQHVHLSVDRETAITVGRRHGRPVVLTVDALRMHREGYVFHLSDNGVWLVDSIPTAYFEIPACT